MLKSLTPNVNKTHSFWYSKINRRRNKIDLIKNYLKNKNKNKNKDSLLSKYIEIHWKLVFSAH